jgi:hypothetical protein
MANLANMLDDEDEVKEGKASASAKGTRGTIPALLLKARTDAHLTHLRQKDKTLATHGALEMFYTGVLDLVDTYVETSMGVDDTFTLEEVEESKVIPNPLQYFKELYNTIQTERATIKETFLQNQIDEMSQLVAHTLYRLRNITT